ncbi:MAG: thiolase family protein [Deltaproteobacteria bacterium]|nr:thiolase family protein [Deltaproteobacteria bacterium]
MADKDVVIAAVARTPFGKYGGALRDVPALALGCHVVKALLERAGLAAEQIDELDMGCCIPAETMGIAAVVARRVLLESGIPPDRPSVTIDRACCSALSACQWAWRSLVLGEAGLVIAGGTDNMSRTPHLVQGLRWGLRLGSAELEDPLYRMEYKGYTPVSVDAGELALEHGVDREAQDRWALQSQQRYEAARKAGKFKEEIAPFPVRDARGREQVIDSDELPRPDTSLEKLAALKTVYGSPTVTAGNAPGLDAGAAGVVLTTRARAAELGLEPLARLVSVTSAAEPPRRIASVPAAAIRKAIDSAGWPLGDLALIEINEAFAAMPLVSSKILAGGDPGRTEALRERINVNGGAIAIGHPIGASGARVLLTLVLELRRRGGGRGAAAICGGLAQGDCALVEV